MSKSSNNLFSKLSRAVAGKSKVDEVVLDDLEEILVSSDVGVATTVKIIDRIEQRVANDKYVNTTELHQLLKEEIVGLLEETSSIDQVEFSVSSPIKPYVIMVVGVNGVGKTTTARILSKALNCLNDSSGNPCNDCQNCNEIASSRSMDVLEIDGASNRGIDEMRNLRELVKYAPINAKFKVFIIDEVHMLTQAAFNALLKTLEEPPSHVKFIFATTEPNNRSAWWDVRREWHSVDERVTFSAAEVGAHRPPHETRRSTRSMAEDVVRRPLRQAPRRAALGTRDMAVDLGAANTVVLVRGEGIVLDEPSVVAVNALDGALLAVGQEAKRMIGRTPPHIRAVRPLRNGVIADFELCEKMLRYFIQQVHNRRWAKPRMVICVPSGVTGVERRAVQEAAEFAGARPPVYIIEEPMAAAIGAGLPVADPTGSMVVDVGGGTTEVAVLSLGGVVSSQSSRIGGDEMDDAIKQFLKKDKGVDVGDRTAEAIKVRLGSAHPLTREFRAAVTGRSLRTGLPESVEFSTREIRDALEEPVDAIIDTVKVTLDRTPPELAADILDHGIHLVGGGSLLIGLPDRIRAETGMPTRVVADPLGSVVMGAGLVLEEFSSYGEMIFGDDGE